MMDIYVFGAVCLSAGIIFGAVMTTLAVMVESYLEERQKQNESRH